MTASAAMTGEAARLLPLLSFIGDSRLLLPAALLTGIVLWRNSRRATLEWWLGIAVAGGVVAASKLASMGFGWSIDRVGFYGISGHSAMSAVVYPVALYALGVHTPRWRRAAAAAIGVMLAIAIAWSRVRLDLHSVSEIAAGLALGSLVAAAVLLRQRDALRAPLPAIAAAWAMSAALVWWLLQQVDLQRALERLAHSLVR